MLKRYFLLLTILAAVLFFWPQLHYQTILSQEDHGRDLYAFAQLAHGKLIYKDIWWDYGPLMPYYYALFDLLFGLKITSVLLGKFILNIIGCIFFYLASCEVMTISWAFLSALFFMLEQQDFFHTYNHIGGIVLFLMLLWLILKLIRQKDPKNNFWILGICSLIGFVKINLGLSALAASFMSIVITQRPKLKTFYFVSILVVPLIWIVVYGLLLYGLTTTEINQCLHYFDNDKALLASPWQSIMGYWNQNCINLLNDWLSLLKSSLLVAQAPIQLLNPQIFLSFSTSLLQILIYPIIYGSIITAFGFSLTKKFNSKRLEFWLIQSVIALFFILNFHEFLFTNIWYRSFWSQPFIIFFCFFMVSITASFAPQRFRYFLGGFFILFFILSTVNGRLLTNDSSKPEKFLTADTGQIYVGNEADWVDTFNTVADYLNKNLKKDELFFAVPREGLFYYLTNKPSPTRQTVFFNSIHINTAQELNVILDLKKNKVKYVLLSNRIKTKSPELGEFGKTYCPLIYHYIMENFTPIWRYGGNWNAAPGWASNHGVIILKRK